MLDLVKYIVNQFAEDKDSVEYEVNEKERVIEIVVTLPASDMGKVIGKQGKIAKAMRTIVRAATPKNGKKYVVEIKEKGGNAVDRDDGGDETEETEEA
ncbi:MAG TPA: KH domain-containing protein [Candidatus Scatosoma pullicola]|nr:KH domain-containing protein [Candidatus Scatosoma pullicola]